MVDNEPDLRLLVQTVSEGAESLTRARVARRDRSASPGAIWKLGAGTA